MNFDEYQEKSRSTAVYPDIGNNLSYPTLGLCGESGEVANKVKKIYRDRGGCPLASDKEELFKELGDVLWYVATVASELGVRLSDVANHNVAKLQDRKDRGALQGRGDNR